MAGRIILETARLILREFDEGDVAAIYALGSDPAVTRYTGDSCRDLEHAAEILRANPLTDYRTHGFGRWACVLKQSGEVVGFCGMKYLPELGGEVDVGYRFLTPYWGQGLATESGHAALDFAFARLGLKRIIGLVDPANAASIRVLEKLGLVYEEEMEYRGMKVLKYAINNAPSA